jgi:hypothetical protein
VQDKRSVDPQIGPHRRNVVAADLVSSMAPRPRSVTTNGLDALIRQNTGEMISPRKRFSRCKGSVAGQVRRSGYLC